MDPLNVRAYLARDWGLFERQAAAHWAEIRVTEGPVALLDLADQLYQEAARQFDLPSEAARSADFLAHERLHVLLCNARIGA